MNGHLISELCRLDFILTSQFQGVFSPNNLPLHVEQYPSAYIVNTTFSTTPGEHLF